MAKGQSFAFETTLSGRSYARDIPIWKAEGYRVTLAFVRLNSADLAVARVKQRVSQGGHSSRFSGGLDNFENLYKPIVDDWVMYDNSGEKFVYIEEGVNNA